MSKKNTLEAKRLRKANKQKDRGHPNFWVSIKDLEGIECLVPYDKAERLTKKQVATMAVVGRAFAMQSFFRKLNLEEVPLDLDREAQYAYTTAN